MRKKAVISPLGMNRDLASSKFDARFSYENKNMRLITDGATSKFVLTNERGPARIDVWFYNNNEERWEVGDIYGSVIGTAVLDNHLVLFTTGKFEALDPDTGDTVFINRDRIYRIDFEDGAKDGIPVKGYGLFRGSLGFDISHPIETLPFYETAELQKVYWTDGINQPRMINIMEEGVNTDGKKYDFAQEISGHEHITVERVDNTNGQFPSGTVQYAYTYYRKYGQESSIATVSPLFFIADDNRGSAPDETVACSFKILAEGLSKKFDGIRLYSIVRTSKNGTPVVKRIADLSITIKKEYIDGAYYDKPFGEAEYVDNNTTGEDIENTYLLFVGAKEITCETLTQKDNTAFYGNISEKHHHVDEALREKLRLGTQSGGAFSQLAFSNRKQLDLPNPFGKYNWHSQLQKSADDIRFFQYRETYRFGVQLQDRYGNWSDVIRLESADVQHGYDFYQGVAPVSDVKTNIEQSPSVDVFSSLYTGLKRHVATFSGQLQMSGISELLGDYIAIRPVVVYPEQKDRSVLGQGILTPTLYNLEDRLNNNIYGQMSWFSRPLCSDDDLTASDISNISQANQITNHRVLEVRQFHPLPPTNRFVRNIDNKLYYGSNAELLCNFDGSVGGSNNDKKKTIDYTYWANIYPWQESMLTDGDVANSNPSKLVRATQLRSEFFVDQSIETFHSPEVEFTDSFANMDMDGLKMRIVGIVPLTYHNEGVYMAVDRITADNWLHIPQRDVQLGGTLYTLNAYRQFTEFGGVQANFVDTIDEDTYSYYGTNKIYPFHTKTLTHRLTGKWDDEDEIRDIAAYSPFRSKFTANAKSTLARKIYDSIRYSLETLYLDTPLDIAIDKPSYFNTIDSGMVMMDVDDESKVFAFNIDKTVVPNTRTKDTETLKYVNGFVYPGVGSIIGDNSTEYGSSGVCGTEGISMKYKGTSSLVMHLASTIFPDGRLVQALPKYGTYNNAFSSAATSQEMSSPISWSDGTTSTIDMRSKVVPTGCSYMWDERYKGMIQRDIADSSNTKNLINGKGYGFFYLAELYRDDNEIHERFGGNSEAAIAANTWVQCGKAVSLRENDGQLKNGVQIEWSMGDTYYQRYDNLHTYPYTEDDINQIVDIVSFMCETRVNVDGRYDRNRGLENNENTRPTNSNRLNDVYNQTPNYFQSRAIDHERISPSEYPMTVAWTKTKQLGEYVDVFTNVTLANTLELDGAKGPVRALRRHFDDVIAFQNTGISRILFNEQQAIQTQAGVPLEIANSGKVTGKMYLTQTIGCHNKWSIATSTTGTYFMDDALQDILHLSSERRLSSIASEKGFRSWVRELADMSHTWDTSSWHNLRSLYDKNNGELLFVTKEQALSFNEQLGQFTSFYDYEKTPFLDTIQNHHVMLRNDGGYGDLGDLQPRTYLFEHNAGAYNNFFGRFRPFWTELLCHNDGTDNDSPLLDKTWTNVGFQFDTFDDDEEIPSSRYKETEHFDEVLCQTEYQYGLTDWSQRYPGIKKTFRLWNADLPRDGYSVEEQGSTADRFRNPWLRLRLTKKKNLDKNWRSVLHSVIIGYLE